MTTPNPDPNQSNQSGNEGDKLYAGKFKTVEELEAGYKNSLPVFQENENLKKRVTELSQTPQDYVNPADLEHEEARINDIKARAKEAGLTQAQYEKLVRDDKRRAENYKSTFENAKKELGEEKVNLLKDYVEKNYPKEIADNMMRTFIGNKEAREAALKHRDQLLSNKVPGMEKTPPATGYRITNEDIRKAYDAKEKNKGDMKARQHYINVMAMKAAQDSAS